MIDYGRQSLTPQSKYLATDLQFVDAMVDYASSLRTIWIEWPAGHPHPATQTPFVEQTNAAYEYAVMFILLHEMCHIVNGDLTNPNAKSPSVSVVLEKQADEYACSYLTTTFNNSSLTSEKKYTVAVGFTMGILSLMLVTKGNQFVGYPDMDSRIDSLVMGIPNADVRANARGIVLIATALASHWRNNAILYEQILTDAGIENGAQIDELYRGAILYLQKHNDS